MKKQKIVFGFLVVIISSIYSETTKVTPMEELNIGSGFGCDINDELNGNVQYNVPFSIYDFKKEGGTTSSMTGMGESSFKQGSSIVEGKAMSVGETRQERQLSSSKPIIVGTERAVILSEAEAIHGIKDISNILFANARINDRGILIVCKGKAEDMLAFNIEGYPASPDYIEGIIKSSTNYNFLFDEYRIFNMYVKLDSEGENLVLPYLEIRDKEITFTGMALFKGEKMNNVLPMEEGKIMNMLRGGERKGILTLQEGPGKYINYDAEVKRKVKCYKKYGKYEFNIELVFKGDIIANTLYKDMDKENQKDFEEFIGKKIEKSCNSFIDKMKNGYKVDCLELGMYGTAKYGRNTGVDWNKEVSNADIKVSVKAKIDKIGTAQP